MSQSLRTIVALIRRALNEVWRVPGAAVPGILAPTIFMLGLSSVFGNVVHVPGFAAHSFRAFIVPVGFLQAASFTGAATGVNLARDIEQGWFDRLLLCPTPRPVLLAGIVGSATFRSLLPAGFLLLVALALGVPFPGFLGLVIAAGLVMAMAAAVAFFSVIVALRFRTQQAAPLMQTGGFVASLFTTSYAPHRLLQPWLATVASINPVTHILQAIRQGFIGQVTWHGTWPGLLSAAGLVLVLGLLATRALRRADY
ncbi:MAG: hypothetical protein NVS3B18_07100 [Candidatus Dormibacteria bacterium]